VITVVNKYKHEATPNDIYIGRPSLLGNPYSHLPNTLAEYRVGTREEAVRNYESYLVSTYHTNPKVFNIINEITVRVMSDKDVYLVCFCKPQSCHGDVIKKFVEHIIEDIRNLK
jgi:hypothetical protein